VAQHVVGAKLSLRYPHLEIENHSYTTADVQLGRPGDFVVGDTVFHVTVAPMPAVIDKCDLNLRNNFRAILLVTDSKLQAVRQMAEIKGIADGAHCLKSTMSVVLAVETDRSLLIEIPANLQ